MVVGCERKKIMIIFSNPLGKRNWKKGWLFPEMRRTEEAFMRANQQVVSRPIKLGGTFWASKQRG